MKTVTASGLRRMILDDRELALLDAREERRFAESHIFYASCCALSRIEKLAPLLVPRRGARVVTCDAGAGEAARAAGMPAAAFDEPGDVPIPIHKAEGGMEKAMNDYLAWEIALPGEVARDGTAAWLRTQR